jgi:uncharacterized protein (DUF362 family)
MHTNKQNDPLKEKKTDSVKSISRREFIATTGAVTAGLLINPFGKSKNAHALDISNYTARVAVTQALDYSNPALIKQKVQHLFESIGGISDVVKAGDKVAVKINLTGGSNSANNPKLQGYDITEAMWTHPSVLRAVCELLLDSGVTADDLYIVEAIWDVASYNNFGYKDVQDDLGVQMVNLNEAAPYTDFMEKETGANHFNYSAFTLNRILDEVDVYVSIPKMKQHYDAGVTHTMKNQVGITPLSFYGNGHRAHLHAADGSQNIRTYLPRSIIDLNLARPVNLGVVDGIINAEGGEGEWNPTFVPVEYHLLLAGKDPVATDSICSHQMCNDPEAEKFQLPNGEECDNYLLLANQIGMGTNKLNEIELVGDGAGLIHTSVGRPHYASIPHKLQLFDNWPNPFNGSTIIRYYTPKSQHVTLKIFNGLGQVVETLVDGHISSGEHQLNWISNHLPSGMYFARLQAGKHIKTQKLILQK